MTNQPAKSFQDLIVWRKAHEVVLLIYPFSQSFPNSETYGLTSQLQTPKTPYLLNPDS
ncbi:MAG: four helix bundle protein [Symploca sp. SIO2D2]|nr:four helix bundle protein [Symploca sp. SIO2D2]